MTNASRDKYRGDESVLEFSALCLKESFANLFRCWEAAVERSEEDPEHVHQLRVASRRTAAALQLFADSLPRRKTDRLMAKLDALRKSAGPARDCDVFAERIAHSSLKEGSNKFADHLLAQRIAAQKLMAAFYKKNELGEDLERLAMDLISGLRPRRPRVKDGSLQFSDWAPRQLRSATRDFFDQADVDPKRLERLHEFRIRAKQFRYSLELLGPALNSDRFKKASVGLKKLSQRLGEINDHATAVETLSRWIDSEFDEQAIQLLRHWRKQERRSLRRAVSDFTDWWTSRRQRQLRRKLKKAAKPADTITAAA